MTTMPAKQNQHPVVASVQSLLAANMQAIRSALPKHMTPERMARVAFSTVQRTPALLKCTPHSLVAAIVESSSLGLEIDGRGLAYLVPYGDRATLIPGYKGLMDLAYRSGKVTSIYAETVHENDEFEYQLGTAPKLVHKPALNNRGPRIAVYAVAQMRDSDPAFVVLGTDEVEKVKKASKAANKPDSPWKQWEDEMWKKTAVRRLCKYLPLSPEMQRAVSLDEQADAGRDQDLASGIIDIPASNPAAEINARISRGDNGNGTAEMDQLPPESSASQDDAPTCPKTDSPVNESECPDCVAREGCPALEG